MAAKTSNLPSQSPASQQPDVLVAHRLPQQQDITFSARALAEEALETVAALMRGDIKASPSIRLRAAQELLDRAVGKAPIRVDVTESLSEEEVRELATQIIQEDKLLT